MIDRKSIIIFKIIHDDGDEVQHRITGRDGQTLYALLEFGKQGMTAPEISSWALRLGSYIHRLRSVYNLDIITHKEKHDGGWHARYELVSKVEIIEVTSHKNNKKTEEE